MEKHDLLHEFPEQKEKIHELKVSDNNFRKLFDEYHEVNGEIYKYEAAGDTTSDEHLNELRLKRVHLKDEIYKYLS